jgi:hypothetical protein
MLTIEGKEFHPNNRNGISASFFMKYLSKGFKDKHCLYVISVFARNFRRYVKIGKTTDMQTRLGYYMTSLYPIWTEVLLHAVYVKRSNAIPVIQRAGKPITSLAKAEARVHTCLKGLGYKHFGEWYQVGIPTLLPIMTNFHFGNKDPPLEGDGPGCDAFLFCGSMEGNKKFKIEREYLNAERIRDIVTSSRANRGKKQRNPDEGYAEDETEID